jgi:DNA-binding transcriptional regulator YhcF (GntR family)
VAITATAGTLLIAIRDNGVGRAYTEMQKRKFIQIHQSKGLALTKERLELYNKTQSTNIQFEIIDQYQDGVPLGTWVVVDFPLKDVHNSS